MQAEEIRLMRMVRQHLLSPVSMHQGVCDLCGVQAQFLSNAMHALRIRSCDFEEEAARAQLLKSWTLRGTMHVFAREDLPLMLHEGRQHFLRACDTLEGDEYISKERKAFFAEWIVKQISDGVSEREALKEACAAQGMTETEEQSLFNAWGGTIRALCEAGRICHVVQEKKAFQVCPPFDPMQKAEAELEMARRYFTHYGPATIKDAAYFFGATQRQVKEWLNQLPVEAVLCEGKTYYVIGCEQNVAASMPECVFLAGFDPLILGYEKQESLFLPQEHLRGIFNLAGIVMPAVLVQGRVVGRWKKTTKLNISLFENVGHEQREWMEKAARRLWGEQTKMAFTRI